MNEQRPDGLTPAQSEAVRRLLAGARHDEGIPDDVAARLEAMITDLAAERAAGKPADDTPSEPHDATVIPLHRRRWPQVLVAAAAVTLFGFGIAQYVGNAGSQDDSAGVSAKEANPDLATRDSGLGNNLSPSSSDVPANQPLPEDHFAGAENSTKFYLSLDGTTLAKLGVRGLHQLRPGVLDHDLADLARTSEGGDDFQRFVAQRDGVRCGPFYTISGGESFAAAYRRHLALVLFHPVLDGVRLVEIYDCDSTTPRRTVKRVTLQTGE